MMQRQELSWTRTRLPTPTTFFPYTPLSSALPVQAYGFAEHAQNTISWAMKADLRCYLENMDLIK